MTCIIFIYLFTYLYIIYILLICIVLLSPMRVLNTYLGTEKPVSYETCEKILTLWEKLINRWVNTYGLFFMLSLFKEICINMLSPYINGNTFRGGGADNRNDWIFHSITCVKKQISEFLNHHHPLHLWSSLVSLEPKRREKNW